MNIKNNDNLKEKLVEYAFKEFIKKGFVSCSTFDIAKSAKIAQSTVYFYFPRKEDLYVACLYHESELFVKSFTDKKHSSFKQVYMGLWDFINNENCLLGRSLTEYSTLPEVIKQSINLYLSGIRIYLSSYLGNVDFKVVWGIVIGSIIYVRGQSGIMDNIGTRTNKILYANYIDNILKTC